MRHNRMLSTAAAAALIAAAAASLFPTRAAAFTTLAEQAPINFTAANCGKGDALIQSLAITGGTLYTTIFSQQGNPCSIVGGNTIFVPSSSTSATRYLAFALARNDVGTILTASSSSTTMGLSRTAGTSFVLTGVATSSNGVTSKVIFEFDLPDTYVAGAAIPIIVNANYTGTGGATAASCTIQPQVYTEINGVEAALAQPVSQQITGTAVSYTFSQSGVGLTPGSHVVLELTMLVTATGVLTGQINSVAIQG